MGGLIAVPEAHVTDFRIPLLHLTIESDQVE
jgi:hypothetical protein